MSGISVGEPAPNFDLPDEQVMPWVLYGELELGPVVLVFYRGDWCPYCNGQLAGYARNFEEFQRRGVRVAGVSVDPPRSNLAMINKLRTPFPLLSDPQGELTKLYGLWNEAESVAVLSIVLVDRMGVVRYLHAGEDFADRPTDDALFEAIDALEDEHDETLSRQDPEVRVAGYDHLATLRREGDPMSLDQLLPYYDGVLFATGELERHFEDRKERKALEEVRVLARMAEGYRRALEQTVELHEEGGPE